MRKKPSGILQQHFGRIRPKLVGRCLPKLGRFQAICWPGSSTFGRNSSNVGPMLAKKSGADVGTLWAEFGPESEPMSTTNQLDAGQMWAEFDRTWGDFGGVRPKSSRSWPMLVVDGQNSAKIGRARPNLGRTRPELGLVSTKCARPPLVPAPMFALL